MTTTAERVEAPRPPEAERGGGGDGLLAVLRRLRSGRAALVVAVVGGVAEAVGAVVSAGTVGWTVGAAASGAPSSALVTGAVWAVVAVVVAAVGTWALGQFGHAFAFRAQADLRLQLFDALERSAPGSLQGRRSGDLATTVLNDVDALEGFFAHLGVGALVAGATGLASAVALTVISPWVALIAVVGMLLAGLVPELLARRGARRSDALSTAVGEVNADVVDGVQGMRELVVHGATDAWWGRIARGSDTVRRLRLAHARAVGTQSGVTDALSAGTAVAVLVVALGLAGAGTITLPAAAVAVTVVMAAMGPVTAAVGMASMLAPLRASARRVLELLDQPEAVPDTATEPVPVARPTVRFDDVWFGYRPGRPVLQGLDLEIPAGVTVAVAGRSGAGKSTAAHLLLRLHDPDAGRITIDGQDLRDMPLSQLRRLVGLVPQDVQLFAGTVADNLRLAAPDASDLDLEIAARDAGAHAFVSALPQGYDTPVGERGALLSGGQRQRLTIARALLTGAPILVLDESSSNLDSENEQRILHALREARPDATTLVIAHRLSTLRSADLVAVLEQGRVAEFGPPAVLAGRDGAYARLVAHQHRDDAGG
ncbi:ABC transporter ATP-binding protein [Pseudonocardia phyllosphaerae]|uniref:ABC transporter ATP-binding protein n=1 Tax=Pseudonocardia phyllosphaerae TaxID=3390502 RepID=UPI00397A919B